MQLPPYYSRLQATDTDKSKRALMASLIKELWRVQGIAPKYSGTGSLITGPYQKPAESFCELPRSMCYIPSSESTV